MLPAALPNGSGRRSGPLSLLPASPQRSDGANGNAEKPVLGAQRGELHRILRSPQPQAQVILNVLRGTVCTVLGSTFVALLWVAIYAVATGYGFSAIETLIGIPGKHLSLIHI